MSEAKHTPTPKAFCYRSGHIQFGTVMPKGAIFLMEAPPKVQEKIEVLARHSRTDESIFIPGVPEALNDEMALNEVHHFIRVVKWALTPKHKRQPNWPRRDFESCAENPALMFTKAAGGAA